MKRSLGARTLLYPTPVCVVLEPMTMPESRMLLTAAWAGICCSSPPCIAVSLRKATYTYGNIMERKAFKISLPSEDYVEKIRPILFSQEGRKYHGVGRLLDKAFSMGKEV